jgi:hypothetical protein
MLDARGGPGGNQRQARKLGKPGVGQQGDITAVEVMDRAQPDDHADQGVAMRKAGGVCW